MDLVPLCFWPGGEAANPDALHPGKAWEHPRGKVYFPPRMFPGFLGPEALKLFVTPALQAELVCLSQLRYFADCGSRVLRTLAQAWGRAAPSVPSCRLSRKWEMRTVCVIRAFFEQIAD